MLIALSIMVLLAMQTDAPMVTIVIVGSVLVLKTDRRGKAFILLVLILMLIRLNIKLQYKPFTQGYITEINASSFLVENGMDHVLVYTRDASIYHPFDRVVLTGKIDPIEEGKRDFGFDVERWAQANRIIGTISEDQTLRFCRDSPGHFILSGGFAQQNQEFTAVFRDILYDTLPDDPQMDFVSLGLQFALLLSASDRFLQRIPDARLATILQFVSLLLFSWLFGFPLTALRFIVFFITARLCNDRKIAFSINIFLFFFIAPHSLSQWTLLIPLAFQFSSIFFMKQKAFFVRFGLLAAIFMLSNGICFPLSILIFPLVRSILMMVSAVFWATTLLPFLAYPALFLYRLFNVLLGKFSFDTIRLIGTM
ncbi:MAG: hypothetical protein E4G74_01260, partial [Erysipelotrichales bacterium]